MKKICLFSHGNARAPPGWYDDHPSTQSQKVFADSLLLRIFGVTEMIWELRETWKAES